MDDNLYLFLLLAPMKRPSIQTQIQITQSKTALEERARRMSWNHTYTPESIADEEALTRELAFMSDQESLFAKFIALYSQSPPPPLWVEKELQFPLPQVWIEELEGRIEFDQRWRATIDEQRQQLPQNQQFNLPDILTQ